MKVLYKWEKCFRFDDYSDAYYLEIPKPEITNELLALLDKDDIPIDDRYYEEVNYYANGIIGPGYANENCIYVLINKKVTKAIVCAVYYPYSGQWGDGCPFRHLYKTELKYEKYLKNAIEIAELSDLKRIDEIIKSKGLEPL